MWFGITSAAVTFGLVLQLVLVVTKDSSLGVFEHTPARVLNFFSFFTVLSNISVAITSGLLASRLDRSSRVFRILRLDAVICIGVTGIVFHLALASLQELTGWDSAADFLLHTLSPILAVLGWLLFGPRGQLDRAVVLRSVIAPLCWLGYALVYGAISTTRTGAHYYAYPFIERRDPRVRRRPAAVRDGRRAVPGPGVRRARHRHPTAARPGGRTRACLTLT